MQYDFDKRVNWDGSGSLKWGVYSAMSHDVIPMWVADMDFQAPLPIRNALHQRIDQGVFGYTLPTQGAINAVLSMLKRNYAWTVEPEWLVWCAGIVPGLNAVTREFAGPGFDTMIHTPVYPRIYDAPDLAGGGKIEVTLKRDGNGWVLDLTAMETAITPQTSVLIFCNPHNPLGHVFTRQELHAVAGFAKQHDLVVCSDEIHADLLMDPAARHIPIAILNNDIASRTITFMAPSKTYNIPGLGCSVAIIPDKELRSRFVGATEHILPYPNTFAYFACEAAYNECDEWLEQCLDYLRENLRLVEAAVAEMPGIEMVTPKATYLAWLDCTSLPVENPYRFFLKHGVALSNSKEFGTTGFVRLNFACPREVLNDGLTRMKNALSKA